MARKTLTFLLNWFASDNHLSVKKAKRVFRNIIIKLTKIACEAKETESKNAKSSKNN